MCDGHQGVVASMSRVETFVTRIKIAFLESRSRDQGDLRTGSRTLGCNLTFEPLKIKRSRVSEENDRACDQVHFSPIKNIDRSHKCFNRRRINDYPWPLMGNGKKEEIRGEKDYRDSEVLSIRYK